MKNDTDRRAFVLPSARVYSHGSLPAESTTATPQKSGGSCCGAPPAQDHTESSGCDSGNEAKGGRQESTGCC